MHALNLPKTDGRASWPDDVLLKEATTVILQGSILEAVPISPGRVLGSPTPTAQLHGEDLPNEEQVYIQKLW